MSSTRDKVLQTVLSRQRCTIKELADVVGINPISVRHHIIKLEADGLVAYEDERHGVGRPRRVYFLTEAGMEKFPTRYLRLASRLLDQMKDAISPTTINVIFEQMGTDIARTFHETNGKGDLTIEERLDLLQELLEKEGFTIEWEKKGAEYHIKELNCPYLQVGQNHPEVCVVDQTLISSVLSLPAERVQCILNGDNYCTYVVPLIQLEEV